MLEIKVLGPGCPNCKKLEEIARRVVNGLGAQANFEKVTDYQEIIKLGILKTPGLIINDEVVSSGRIPSESEVAEWVNQALKAS
mgnify:CR=1 FL=1